MRNTKSASRLALVGLMAGLVAAASADAAERHRSTTSGGVAVGSGAGVMVPGAGQGPARTIVSADGVQYQIGPAGRTMRILPAGTERVLHVIQVPGGGEYKVMGAGRVARDPQTAAAAAGRLLTTNDGLQFSVGPAGRVLWVERTPSITERPTLSTFEHGGQTYKILAGGAVSRSSGGER